MVMKRQGLSGNLRSKITLMIVPHHTSRPLRISISLFSVTLLGLVLLAVGGLAVFVLTRHIDYLQTKKINENLQKENEYFAEGLIKARGLADDLKVMQSEVLSLLKLKPKKKIPKYKGKGGYSSEEPFSLTEKGFEQNLGFLKTEVKERKEDLATIQKTPLIWPTEGRITSPYGYRFGPFSHRREFHKGIDIANALGTPIKAPADGVVVQVGWKRRGLGHYLVINHGEISTKFGHCHKILVKKGERIKRGQIIALMGSTGMSTGSHLHYEVRIKDRPVNPWYYLCLKMKDDNETKETKILSQNKER